MRSARRGLFPGSVECTGARSVPPSRPRGNQRQGILRRLLSRGAAKEALAPSLSCGAPSLPAGRGHMARSRDLSAFVRAVPVPTVSWRASKSNVTEKSSAKREEFFAPAAPSICTHPRRLPTVTIHRPSCHDGCPPPPLASQPHATTIDKKHSHEAGGTNGAGSGGKRARHVWHAREQRVAGVRDVRPRDAADGSDTHRVVARRHGDAACRGGTHGVSHPPPPRHARACPPPASYPANDTGASKSSVGWHLVFLKAQGEAPPRVFLQMEAVRERGLV